MSTGVAANMLTGWKKTVRKTVSPHRGEGKSINNIRGAGWCMNRVYFVLIRFIFLTNIANCGIIRLGGRETACSHFEIRECTKKGKIYAGREVEKV